MCQLAHHRPLAQTCFLPVRPSALMWKPLARLAMDDSSQIPASTPASAAQPGSTMQNFQSFQMLRSKQSVKISTFKVIVCNPWNDSYKYE